MHDDGYTVEHLTVVTYDDNGHTETDRAVRYRAECSCGWTGDEHDDGALAEADADDHRETIVGPADAVDRLISGLLDLQDDLARTVMWLAEHWNTDLPCPAAMIGSDAPGVRLSAYCLDPDDLEQAADVLGVPLVDDPTPDAYGNRYRRGVRQFGRVRVEVFRHIDPACSGCGTATDEAVCPVCGQHADARPITLEVA